MFLFTTPPASTGRDPAARTATGTTVTGTTPRTSTGAATAGPVVDAIQQGAARTGASFDYLLATAQRESALDPAAKNGGSSATGLFQFIEQTWLGTLKSDGPRLGLGEVASAITARGDGTYGVGDAGQRQSILDLRKDPQVASTMAGALTLRNRDALAAAIGREPSGGELYAAHVLGARGASDLIQTAATNPERAAANDFPEAAAANRTIFYDRAGRARGAAEVVSVLGAGQSAATPQGQPAAPAAAGRTLTGLPASAAPSFGPDQPLAFARTDGPVMHSLFQTENRRGPISEGVAKLWQARAAGATDARAPGFFPRSDTAETAAAPEAAVAGATAASPSVASPSVAIPSAPTSAATYAAALTSAPLPPRRPAEFGGEAGALTGDAVRAPARRAARTTPLDLSAFMRPRT